MKRSFTIADIDALWTAYRAASALRVLKDGRWETRLTTEQIGRIDGTRAERVPAHMTLTFPDWLRKAGHA